MIPLFVRLNYRTESLLSKLGRVDWTGSIIFIGSTASFLVPLTWGGVLYPWNNWRTLVPMIVGIVGLVFFVVYSRYVAAEPLIRGGIFKSRTAQVSYVGTVLHGAIVSVCYVAETSLD